MRGSDMEKIKSFFNSIGHFFKEKFQNHRESVKQEKYEKEHDLLFKRKKAEKVAFVIMFVVFALFALSFIFPFLWILMNSFKTKSEFAKDFMSQQRGIGIILLELLPLKTPLLRTIPFSK